MEQSLLYAAAMFWLLGFAFVALMLAQFDLAVPLWIYVCFGLSAPSQGIFNLWIHLRRKGRTKSLFCSFKRWNTLRIATQEGAEPTHASTRVYASV